VLSRDQIEQALQIPCGERRSNVVEVHIHHLRRCLPPGQLQTVRGQGYRLVVSATGDETEGSLRE
jgi:DNA-binding response OmpR family regulator